MFPFTPYQDDSRLAAEWFSRKQDDQFGSTGIVYSRIGDRIGEAFPGRCVKGDSNSYIQSDQYTNRLSQAGQAASFSFWYKHSTDSTYLLGTPSEAPFSYMSLFPAGGGHRIGVLYRSEAGIVPFDSGNVFNTIFDFSVFRKIAISVLLVDITTLECTISLYVDDVLRGVITGYGGPGENSVTVSCTSLLTYGNGGNSCDGFMFDYRDYNCDYSEIVFNGFEPTGRETRWFTFEGDGTTIFDSCSGRNHAEFINPDLQTYRATDSDVPFSFINEFGYSGSRGGIVPPNLIAGNYDASGSTLDNKGQVRLPLQFVESSSLSFDGASFLLLESSVLPTLDDEFSVWFQTDGSTSTGYLFHSGVRNCLEGLSFHEGKLIVYPANGASDILEGTVYDVTGAQASVVSGSGGSWNQLRVVRELFSGQDAYRYYIGDQAIGLAIKAVSNAPILLYVGVANDQASQFFTGKMAGVVSDGSPVLPLDEGSGTTVTAYTTNNSTVNGNVIHPPVTPWGSQDVYHNEASKQFQNFRRFPTAERTCLRFPDCPATRMALINPSVSYSAQDLESLNNDQVFVQVENNQLSKLLVYRFAGTQLTVRAHGYTKQ